MEFSLCPKDATSKDFAQRCTVLQRADGKGPHWTLPPGELPDPQGRPLIPKYTDASFTYYIYPENDDFRDTPVYILKYVLPAGYKCEACVLRWYWLTGNACNPPCEKSDPLYPNCNRLSMGYCGDAKALAPEEVSRQSNAPSDDLQISVVVPTTTVETGCSSIQLLVCCTLGRLMLGRRLETISFLQFA
jgi:hypothetical protein